MDKNEQMDNVCEMNKWTNGQMDSMYRPPMCPFVHFIVKDVQWLRAWGAKKIANKKYLHVEELKTKNGQKSTKK